MQFSILLRCDLIINQSSPVFIDLDKQILSIALNKPWFVDIKVPNQG